MTAALLLLFPLIGGPPVRFEPPVVREPAAKVQAVKVTGWHFPQPGERLKPGNHWHACACGRVTQHDDRSFGNVRDHTCVCGRVNWTHAR